MLLDQLHLHSSPILTITNQQLSHQNLVKVVTVYKMVVDQINHPTRRIKRKIKIWLNHQFSNKFKRKKPLNKLGKNAERELIITKRQSRRLCLWVINLIWETHNQLQSTHKKYSSRWLIRKLFIKSTTTTWRRCSRRWRTLREGSSWSGSSTCTANSDWWARLSMLLLALLTDIFRKSLLKNHNYIC